MIVNDLFKSSRPEVVSPGIGGMSVSRVGTNFFIHVGGEALT